ncbi:MAG: ABC transporter ATP-binding protein [Acidimicrobiales bacterium]
MVNEGLQLEDLGVSIDDTPILRDIGLHVRPGQIVVLLGPSGCGKSTLLRAIAGLQPIDHGRILWDGVDLAATAVHQRGFGLMFQQDALFPHRSVGGNVAFGLEMQGSGADDVAARSRELLAQVGLPGFEPRSVASLSGGEAQRVALARALAPRPRLLLLDEPLASLDRLLREQLVSDLALLRSELSLTAVHVTHDRDEAFALADHIGIMRQGRIVAAGPPDALWAAPPTEWVARFLGHHNVVPVLAEGGRLVSPVGDLGPTPDTPDQPTAVLLLGESVQMVAEGPVAGTVKSSRFTARGFECVVEVGDTDLVATADHRVSPGTNTQLAIDASRRHLLYPDQPR